MCMYRRVSLTWVQFWTDQMLPWKTLCGFLLLSRRRFDYKTMLFDLVLYMYVYINLHTLILYIYFSHSWIWFNKSVSLIWFSWRQLFTWPCPFSQRLLQELFTDNKLSLGRPAQSRTHTHALVRRIISLRKSTHTHSSYHITFAFEADENEFAKNLFTI